MNGLKMHSINKVDDNITKIGKLFPNCLTERKNENGETEYAIDFDILRQELSKEIVESNEERYQFTWPDKKQSILLANAPIAKTLRPCREESVDFDSTENLYIEGDNLDVLKLLQETYLGKVKMIYIDPPYNTGNDFVYEDDFAQNTDDYLANSGQYDEDGNRLVQNNESNARFHTDWLNMIYPRLKVAKDLLADNGSIFISIDDKEVANTMKVCNDIFGEFNFVGNIIWQSRTSISNDYEISKNHNHTLVYSKNRKALTFGGEKIDPNEYINSDNDPRGPWKLVPIDANHVGGETLYPITNPKTNIQYFPPNGRVWCYNETTFMELMRDGRIKFGLSNDSAPKRKLYYNERIEKGDCKTPSSVLLDAGTTKSGTVEIMNLFDNMKIFDYPKPSSLIQRLIKYGFVDNEDIIMDFFSGSGTTAHSTFAYNADNVERKTKCKFILVQYPEDLNISLVKANNDAKKTIQNAISYLDKIKRPHNICEIGKERIRRAGKKIKGESSLTTEDLDIGFRVLKLDSSNMKDVYYNPAEYRDDLFDSLTDNIKEDRTAEDLLFQVMLDLGMLLSGKIEKTEIAGKEVFNVENGYLIACFDKNITEETIKAISQQKPYYFVMRDSSLASDSVAANFEQIFATYSPETIRKIL